MQTKFRKLLSSLLVFSLVLLFSPVDFLHHLLEDHQDELHLCHSDFCVRTFEGHCDLCDHMPPVYYSFPDIGLSAPVTIKCKIYSTESIFYYSNHHLLPLNKAPPIS